MRLIAGLGNPEVKYMKTRHNIGFMVLDEILRQKNLRVEEKFKSFCVKAADVLFLMPKTYMNLSGLAIVEAMNFYKINIDDILIVYDDVSLNLGTLRFRKDGSDGGHNGIKSIIEKTGSKNFARLKVGIGQKPEKIPLDRFVLGEFSKEEKAILDKIIPIAAEASLSWLNKDIQTLQNSYNKSFLL